MRNAGGNRKGSIWWDNLPELSPVSESDWLKRGKRGEVPIVEADLRRDDPEGAEVPTALELAADPRPDPEQVVLASES